jgi:putative phosphoesterase
MSAEEPAPLAIIGVVADTHVPDRVSGLHPDLLTAIQAIGVERILHAGDVSSQPVLDALSEIAPVTAVRGNRDWMGGLNLERVAILEIAGIKIALLHGHGTPVNYVMDKFLFLASGYRLGRYIHWMEPDIQDARVVVFGHTHRTANQMHENVLYFNPGSAAFTTRENGTPSFGVLKVFPQGRIKGEIIRLRGYRLENREWVKI